MNPPPPTSRWIPEGTVPGDYIHLAGTPGTTLRQIAIEAQVAWHLDTYWDRPRRPWLEGDRVWQANREAA